MHLVGVRRNSWSPKTKTKKNPKHECIWARVMVVASVVTLNFVLISSHILMLLPHVHVLALLVIALL